ncbi:MAG TPA: biopolymer transporter ExbD [Planctomycetaceae bacterium]|nr:biopolymer transporter ExbD [Planctomycetaceae bacterium]HIQ22857.1 biopolymer transporter ExbD [Planctomycetota bacterium]
MKVPSHSAHGAVGFNMTPMIDVVFLLIIFFLVSSHLARQESQVDLDLPSAATGNRPDQRDDVRRLVVNVLPKPRPEGRLQVAGRVVGPDQFAAMIAYERRRSARPLEVRIRSHRLVPYRDVEPVMTACVRAGVWNVTFAVTAER